MESGSWSNALQNCLRISFSIPFVQTLFSCWTWISLHINYFVYNINTEIWHVHSIRNTTWIMARVCLCIGILWKQNVISLFCMYSTWIHELYNTNWMIQNIFIVGKLSISRTDLEVNKIFAWKSHLFMLQVPFRIQFCFARKHDCCKIRHSLPL